MSSINAGNNIMFIGSRNLSDDSDNNDDTKKEIDVASLQELLNKQGVSILKEKKSPENIKPHDEVSRELMDEGGIEIIRSYEEDPLI